MEKNIAHIAKAPKDSKLEIRFADGSIIAHTKEHSEEITKTTKLTKKEKHQNEKQISLFDI